MTPAQAAMLVQEFPEFAREWAANRIVQHVLAGAQVPEPELVSAMGDWLASLPTERPKMVAKLYKLPWAAACTAQAAWHESMVRRSGRLASFGGKPDDAEVLLELDSGYRWVRVTTPEGLDYEGAAMGHCVGRGSYDAATIYSLRDSANMPHCTVEWEPANKHVRQVKGRANAEVVERYHPMVRRLVDLLEPHSVNDAEKFGHAFVAIDGYRRLVSSLQVCGLNGVLFDGGITFDFAGYPPGTGMPVNCTFAGPVTIKNANGLIDFDIKCLFMDSLTIENCNNFDGVGSPADNVKGSISIKGCKNFTSLPRDMYVSDDLLIDDCERFKSLPPGLVVNGSVRITSCASFTGISEVRYIKSDLIVCACPAFLCLMPGAVVGDELIIRKCDNFCRIEPGFMIGSKLVLDANPILRELPPGLDVSVLRLSDCVGLLELPQDLVLHDALIMEGCPGIKSLPIGLAGLALTYIVNCTGLESIAQKAATYSRLTLRDCTSLKSLPQGIEVNNTLDLEGCTSLVSLPDGIRTNGSLDLRKCTSLQHLPSGLDVGNNLYLMGCTALETISDDIKLRGRARVDGCLKLAVLPPSFQGRTIGKWGAQCLEEETNARDGEPEDSGMSPFVFTDGMPDF